MATKKQKPLSIAKIRMGDVMIGAVATDKYNYQPLYDRHQTMDKVVSYMGFDDANSYMDQYPGTFLEKSNIIKSWVFTNVQHYHNPIEIFLNLYCSVIHIVNNKDSYGEMVSEVSIFIRDLKMLLSRGMFGNGSFMLPLTTDEVKHSLGFTDVPKSEMWYCIDWKG